MKPSNNKFKMNVGDLVNHCGKEFWSIYGIGVIIDKHKNVFSGNLDDVYNSYQVYWTKVGLSWHNEEFLQICNRTTDGTNNI